MKLITETLKKNISEHGNGIIQNEQKLKAILSDLHPTEKKLRNLLELSLRAEIPKKLIELQPEKASVWETKVSLLKHYFKEEFFLQDAAVKLVFNCWLEIFPSNGSAKESKDSSSSTSGLEKIKHLPPSVKTNPQQELLSHTAMAQKSLHKHIPQPGLLLTGTTFFQNELDRIRWSAMVGKTVKMGKQVWMAENLNVTHYRNGDIIPNVTDNTVWANLNKGACCDFENDSKNAVKYGKLYNWFAVSDKRNIAPEGWHVATDEDLAALIAELGGKYDAGSSLRSDYPFKVFSAILCGRRFPDGRFLDNGKQVMWHRSPQYGVHNNNKSILLTENNTIENLTNFCGTHGFYVRCVKD